MTYINFFPGDMNDERSIELSEIEAYGTSQDLSDFIGSIHLGVTASISAEGVKDALEDGELLGAIASEQGIDEAELQDIVEELHDVLSR